MKLKFVKMFLTLCLCGGWAVNCGEGGTDESVDPENSAALCSDGADNDGDGAADCLDAECTAFCTDSETVVPDKWITTWVSSQQITESGNLPPEPGLAENTLRQNIQITLGGSEVRFSFSNVFGNAPVTIVSASAALSGSISAVAPNSLRMLTFAGESSVSIGAGSSVSSDPLTWELAPFSELAVSLLFDASPPSRVTGHPGSRTTSYILPGDAVAVEEPSSSTKTEHWYFLSAVDVMTDGDAKAIVTLGDSITDGRGSTTNGNDRWPNDLARRLADRAGTENVAVLNQGVGGNCLTRTCLGPAAVDRFDRDVLEPIGVQWLIILEGINDLANDASITAERLIAALTEMAERAHAEGITVIGGTIMPCEGNSYFSEDLETKRQSINEWIRTTDVFDAVIDFDEITRDPEAPTKLSAAVDGGDGLHPSAAGYKIMADAIDLTLFEKAL